jgi:excisionase family DNA binding protein
MEGSIVTGRIGVWMSIEETAEYAQTSAAAVRAAIERRELNGVTTHPRGPGQWMIQRDEVDRWVATLRDRGP